MCKCTSLLLVINSNFGRICYRFRDIDASLMAIKMADFLTQPLFDDHARGGDPLEFMDETYPVKIIAQFQTVPNGSTGQQNTVCTGPVFSLRWKNVHQTTRYLVSSDTVGLSRINFRENFHSLLNKTDFTLNIHSAKTNPRGSFPTHAVLSLTSTVSKYERSKVRSSHSSTDGLPFNHPLVNNISKLLRWSPI